MGLTREQVKAERKKLGIGTTILAKMALNKGLGDKKTIAIHNEYAKQIFSEAYGDEELMELAKTYISELPKAARKGEETEYRALCNQKLEAFRATVQRLGLEEDIKRADENADNRFQIGEAAADLRSLKEQKTIVETGESVLKGVEYIGDDIKKTVQNEGTKTRKTVQNEGAKTRNTVKQEADGIKEHVTAEHNITREHVTSEHEITREVIQEEGRVTRSTVRTENERTRDTVREEGAKTRANQNENAKLTAKRQTLSDMLNEEISGLNIGKLPGTGGIYRDSTIKWLGGAADRVIGDSKLTPEQKEKALDELIRMVDEELVITDGDKEEFNNTYFPKPKK